MGGPYRRNGRRPDQIGGPDILSADQHPQLPAEDGADTPGPDELPWPGDELVSRVAGGLDRPAFYQSGRQSVADIEAVLGVIGRRLDSYGQILDFGCGCGRILLWLEHLAATSEVHGVDIDGRAIKWAQGQFPWAELKVNQPLPPLDYPDATFDLVYNHSVFTHLDEQHQDQWLAELQRVTRPGAHLVLSVHGEKALADFETGSRNAGGDPAHVREQVLRNGIAFIEHDSFIGGPFPGAYHSTFHAPWYVLDHWSRFFDVKAYVPQGSLGFQDFVLLERRSDDAVVSTAAQRASATAPAYFAGAGPRAEAEPLLPAVERAVSAPLHGPAPDAPARYGALTRVVRKALQRVLFHHADYQRGVDQRFQGALKELDAAVGDLSRSLDEIKQSGMVAGAVTLAESNVRLWDSLRRHGERINRLEADLWAALESKADRPGASLAPPPAGAEPDG